MTALAGGPEGLRTVHVIVTCSNRKTRPIPAALRLDNVPGSGTEARAREWVTRLAGTSSTPLIAAQDLYAGEHWTIARGLPSRACRAQVRLWICSAGYGLIPAESHIRPYAAAFSGGTDRVPGGADGARQWWNALAYWEGPAQGEPRSIRSLAASDPFACILLALSASYLDACRDDVEAAAWLVAEPDNFMVISAGSRLPGSLGAAMVPTDARLQAFLGGTRQALNARIAAYLLSAGISSRVEATHCMTLLLAKQPPVIRYERKQLSDQEVMEMIVSRLAEVPGMSASRLLREFRDVGYACEQERFGKLHRQVVGAGR